MASTTVAVKQSGGSVFKGAGAGLCLAFAVKLFGPLLGSILGAIIAGMIMKGQRALIAFLAGFLLLFAPVRTVQAAPAAQTVVV